MALLIDGYNLLHVTGIFGKGRGPGGLQRSRYALLRFLAASIEPSELPRTTVVFDATDAPPGLPRVVTHEGITVRYATGYPDADALIEELIAADHSPRQLLVVSSDHRIQRAARRRRAKITDSDAWYAEIRRRSQQVDGAVLLPGKPTGDLSDAEVAYWLEQFGQVPAQEGGPSSASSDAASSEEPEEGNIFPPGYGDDLSP